MKKLAILASVVMIVTAPIMAQQATTSSQEELGLWDIAKEYVFGSDDEDSIKSLDQNKIDALLQKALGDPIEALKQEPSIKDQAKAAGVIGILVDAAKDAFIAKNPQWAPYGEKLAGALNFLKQNYPQLLQSNTGGVDILGKFFRKDIVTAE